MKRGGKFLGFTAILAITACGGEQGKLTIRSTGTPLSAQAKPVSFRVAEARAQFALGNIALALESFRKAVRDDPRNIDAMTGLAASYDRMGRYDLSRKHYEAALAVEPANASVLSALAASLDVQGKSDEAAAVRKEIRERVAAATIPVAPAKPVQPIALVAPTITYKPIPTQHQVRAHAMPTRMAAVTAVLVPAKAPAKLAAVSMPPKSPAVAPAPVVAPARAVAPARVVAQAPVVTPAAVVAPGPVVAPTPVVTPAPVTAPAPVVATAAIAPTAPARSVTIKLPPPRPVAAPAPRQTAAAVAQVAPPAPAPREPEQPVVAAALPAPAPVPKPTPVRSANPVAITFGAGPRLERTSMAEVSLITRGAETLWKPHLVQQTANSSTIRFVPLRQAQARVPIRVLNAARVDRLAANTRRVMARRGWNNVVIGNARMARTHSLVLYPARSRLAAQKLAAQLGFASALHAQSRQVTVLLGRDATRLVRKRATA